tara:strand:+ start:502 stop:684 length:183 start_codon:yes stop_codon:yes gene_type:complete
MMNKEEMEVLAAGFIENPEKPGTLVRGGLTYNKATGNFSFPSGIEIQKANIEMFRNQNND